MLLTQVAINGRDPSWGARIYSLDPVGDYALFNISNATGAVTAAAPLVWNAQASYALTVRCSDASAVGPVLSSTMAVTISLIQVNTVTITQFALPPATPASSGVVVNGSAYNATLAGNDILVAPAGYVDVWLLGTGFGKTAARLARDGQLVSSTTVTATLGATGTELEATLCSVVTANTVIRCRVPPGVGAFLLWNVTINGAWACLSSARMGFFPPTVSAVTLLGTAQLMPTNAAAMAVNFKVMGTNFGPTQMGPGPSPIYLSPTLTCAHAGRRLGLLVAGPPTPPPPLLQTRTPRGASHTRRAARGARRRPTSRALRSMASARASHTRSRRAATRRCPSRRRRSRTSRRP